MEYAVHIDRNASCRHPDECLLIVCCLFLMRGSGGVTWSEMISAIDSDPSFCLDFLSNEEGMNFVLFGDQDSYAYRPEPMCPEKLVEVIRSLYISSDFLKEHY